MNHRLLERNRNTMTLVGEGAVQVIKLRLHYNYYKNQRGLANGLNGR